MEIIVTKSFHKDLRKCPKYIIEKIGGIIALLESAENINESTLDYTKMEGQKRGESYYRIRVGGWRVGIELKTAKVILLIILPGGEIYKDFPPK